VVIDPQLLNWQEVAENYNPHGDGIPISCSMQKTEQDEYMAFCSQCAKKEGPLLLIQQEKERMLSLHDR